MQAIYVAGGCVSRRLKPASLALAMLLLHQAWPVGGTASRLTSSFQGQLFHRRFASTGSYVPTMRRPPVGPTELRACALSLIPPARLVAQGAAAPTPPWQPGPLLHPALAARARGGAGG